MLVGRPTECARLDALLAAAATTQGDALVVSGGPGVGKTALLRHAERQATEMRVLSAAGVEGEVELAFSGISQLVAPILDRLDELPDVQRAALGGALGFEPAGSGDRFATAAAFLGLISAAAEARPVLVLIDDAQLLDPASQEALGFAARRLGRDLVAMVVAIREEPGAAVPWAGLPRLHLDGLTLEAAEALLRERAGTAVADPVAKHVWVATSGNPLALCEVAALLSRAQLRGDEPLPEPLPVGPRIGEAFRRRLRRLPEATQRALLMAAASDTGDLDELAAALSSEGMSLDELEPAESASLVALGHGGLWFSHPLVRSVVYHGAAPVARRAAHGALARTTRVGDVRGRRAWHLAAATVAPDEEIARELAAAGTDARLRGGPATAGRMFAQAALLTPSADGRRQRLLEAAESYHLAGNPDSAIPLLDQALALADSPDARADVQSLRGRVELLRGQVSDTCTLLIGEADRIEPHSPPRAASMLADACTAYIYAGQLDRALEVAQRAVALTEPSQGPAHIAASIALTGALILIGDGPTAEPVLDRLLPAVAEEPLLRTPLPAYVGTQLGWLEHERPAEQLLLRAIDRARTTGAVELLPFALAGLTYVQLRLGNWISARARATEGVALAEDIGQRTLGYDLAALALVEAGQGDSACRDHGERALELAHQWGNTSLEVMVPSAEGSLDLALGDFDQAGAQLERARSAAREGSLREPAVARWAPDLIETYIHQGRHDDADRELGDFRRQAEKLQRRGALAAAARCRGLLAEPGFEEHFRDALRLHELEQAPFEQARTELCFGETLRRARRRSDARPWLFSALGTFERLSAKPWAEMTRRELRATGQHARQRTQVTSDELTPQELHVALAIAEGATNREAAAALFLSPKTIEAHLTSSYRKLGVRSRTELAVKLGRERVTGAPAP